MGYDSLARMAASTIDAQTASLQDTIEFYAWKGAGNYGESEYDDAVLMQAVVEEKQVLRRMTDGTEIAQKASVTIPRPIPPNGATGRREPVDPRDKIVLPNGFTGPILFVNGEIDPTTHAPYSYEIVLG